MNYIDMPVSEFTAALASSSPAPGGGGASALAAALGAGDGDIVLMHDLRPETAAAVEKIVPQLLEQGYKLVTVSEMFEAKGIELTMGKSYRKAK